jgi:hypothetical protein
MRIQPEYMSFKMRCMITSSYEFQAQKPRSQRRCCFSQDAQLLFEVLPDAPRVVPGGPRCSDIHHDRSPGRWEACNSPSVGTRCEGFSLNSDNDTCQIEMVHVMG